MAAQELADLEDQPHRYDLIHGKLMEQHLGDFEHGLVAATIATALWEFVTARALGVVAMSAGFWLAREPDTVLGPDVAFVSAERLPPRERWSHYAELAPDLAVEVVSQFDRLGGLMNIADTYIQHGVRCLWIVYPADRRVAVWTPDAAPRLLREDDIFEGGDVLPGFSIRVGELFEY